MGLRAVICGEQGTLEDIVRWSSWWGPGKGSSCAIPHLLNKAHVTTPLCFKTKQRLTTERANVCLEGPQSTQRLTFLSLTLGALYYLGE